MTPDRCPQCGAALPAAASWCSLCFHDLAAQPAVPGPEAQPSVLSPVALPAYAEEPQASAVSLAERPAGWPCSGCGALVALELMACPTCGAPFLPSDANVALPLVGDPRSLSTGMKVAIMAGGSTAVALVVIVLFVVLGSIF